MRQAVFLLLVAGVFHCAFCRPDGTLTNSEEANLQSTESQDQVEARLQEDGPQLQNDNNVDEAEDELQEIEGEKDDNEAAAEGMEGDIKEESVDQYDAEDEADNDLSNENEDGNDLKTTGEEVTALTTSSPESKVLQTGNKKRRTKNSGPSKKMASKLLPLLMIPLMIQAQLIPMMLLKLKFMALKALMLGKAALVIILLNLLKNAFLGADSMEEQYEQQTLASHHYGYSGAPEYGAWLNRRVYTTQANSPYRGHQFVASAGHRDTAGRTVLDPTAEADEEST